MQAIYWPDSDKCLLTIARKIAYDKEKIAAMNFKDIKERTLYGSFAGVIAIGCTMMGGLAFLALCLFATYIMAREWQELTRDSDVDMRWVGAAYIVLPVLCLLYLRLDIHLFGGGGGHGLSQSLVPTFILLFGVWATDIAAFFVGKLIGKHPMAPSVSPNKTWEGLGGGMIASGALYGVASLFGLFPASLLLSIFIGVFLALVAQMGDLYESSLKRAAGVKDSGTLIPGHGGLLDRVDGLLAATPVFTLIWWVV